MEKPALI